MKKILTIDQGTTSSRSIIFNNSFDIINESQQEYALSFPKDGWVEHNPEEIWKTTLKVLKEVIKKEEAESKQEEATKSNSVKK